jgi:hypothetical protein
MRVVAGGAKRARLRPSPQFYGLLPSRAVSHEKPCAMAHESHVGNGSQERQVDTPHVVRCVVAGTCGYTCRPLTSRASLTRHLFIWSSRDLPRSPEIQLQIPSGPRSLPSHVPVHLPARSLECRAFAICTDATVVPRQIRPETGDSPDDLGPARDPGHPRHVVLLLDQKAYLNRTHILRIFEWVTFSRSSVRPVPWSAPL